MCIGSFYLCKTPKILLFKNSGRLNTTKTHQNTPKHTPTHTRLLMIVDVQRSTRLIQVKVHTSADVGEILVSSPRVFHVRGQVRIQHAHCRVFVVEANADAALVSLRERGRERERCW